MKRLARWVARLYPRGWRARYGIEFDALLQDVKLTWRDLFDLFIAAMRLRIGKGGIMEPRIVDLASRDIPHGYELESAVELPREGGDTMLVRYFSRELDFGDSYLTLNHWSRGAEPAQTVIIFGKKGEVEGDFRTDETEMLHLRADGSVHRTEQTVKTSLHYDAIRERLRDRYRAGLAAGRTPDEIHREIVAGHSAR